MKKLVILSLFTSAMFTSAIAFAQNPEQNPEEDAWQALNTGLKDSSPMKRVAAVTALSIVKPQPKVVATIEEMLTDKDLGVRQAACAALGEIKSRTSISRLEGMLDDKAPEVIFAAARALYAMNDANGTQVLIDILLGEQKDASGFVSSSIRDAKLKLHDPKALMLVGVNQAAGFLGPFGMGVPVAEQLMKDGQASGKTVAALLLATDTGEASKVAVKQALADKNWTVRAAACRAAAMRELRAYYVDITPLLADKRDEVKYSAAAALIRLKQTPAVRRASVKMTPAKK